VTPSRSCALCRRRPFLGLRAFQGKWHSERGLLLCRACWPDLSPVVEWFEERNAALETCIGGSLPRRVQLFKLLTQPQAHLGVEDGQWLTERVIEHLALPGGQISFEFKELDSNMAGSVNGTPNNGYLVAMSRGLQDNFRALSAVLIHEMMHIYLGNHGLLYNSQQECEELTDLACVMLGFGVPLINAKRAWLVDRKALGVGSLRATGYYNLGYLTEPQIGYAFARFLMRNEIALDEVRPGIDPHCMGVVRNGVALENSHRTKVVVRRKAKEFLETNARKREIREFACPVCLLRMGVPKDTVERLGVFKLNCRQCGSEIHFDGERVVKYRASVR